MNYDTAHMNNEMGGRGGEGAVVAYLKLLSRISWEVLAKTKINSRRPVTGLDSNRIIFPTSNHTLLLN